MHCGVLKHGMLYKPQLIYCSFKYLPEMDNDLKKTFWKMLYFYIFVHLYFLLWFGNSGNRHKRDFKTYSNFRTNKFSTDVCKLLNYQ